MVDEIIGFFMSAFGPHLYDNLISFMGEPKPFRLIIRLVPLSIFMTSSGVGFFSPKDSATGLIKGAQIAENLDHRL